MIMENILKVIDDITNDRQVKSIINSVNDNQEKVKTGYYLKLVSILGLLIILK